MTTGPGGPWSDLLEQAIMSDEIGRNPTWTGLHDWLGMHGADAALLDAAREAEQRGIPFPSSADELIQAVGSQGAGDPGGEYRRRAISGEPLTTDDAGDRP